MKKIRVAIVSDKAKVWLRPEVKKWIEQNNNLEVVLLEVVLLSRLKISRIRREIVPEKPDLVFITASLLHPEEFNELWGFVKKLRKHLPQSNIVVHTPWLPDSQKEKISEAGANRWIDDRLKGSSLGRALTFQE